VILTPPPVTADELRELRDAIAKIQKIAAQSVASRAPATPEPALTINPFGSGKKKSGTIGEPGALEGCLPFWGSGREALEDFQQGNYVSGSFNAVMAVTDVVIVKSLLKSGWRWLFRESEKEAERAIGKTVARDIENQAGRDVEKIGIRSEAGGTSRKAINSPYTKEDLEELIRDLPDSPRVLPAELDNRVKFFSRSEADATFAELKKEGFTSRSPAFADPINGTIYIDREVWARLPAAKRSRLYFEELEHSDRALRRSRIAKETFMRRYKREGLVTFWEEFVAARKATTSTVQAIKHAWRYITLRGALLDFFTSQVVKWAIAGGTICGIVQYRRKK
jgi:hypothetical protein